MRTAADAGILAGCCALLWLIAAPLAVRLRWFARVPLYAVAAAGSTAAAAALGHWREHVQLTAAGVGGTFAGMCAFWLLVALQGRRHGAGRTVEASAMEPIEETPGGPDGPAGAGTPTPNTPADGAALDSAGADATLTRRQRRLAQRRRMPVPRRRKKRNHHVHRVNA